MKGFIELTKMIDRNGGCWSRPAYEIGGPICINVMGIESYTGNRVTTLSGDTWVVKETFQEIKVLIEEALKEE